VLEISISFLVVLAVVTIGVYSVDKYFSPLGYSIDNVWNVAVDRGLYTDDWWLPDMPRKTELLLTAAREMPEVEHAAAVSYPPYSLGSSISGYDFDGFQMEFESSEATDGFADVLKLKVEKGRWFSKEDDGAAYKPVVINLEAARRLFGAADPVGKTLMPPS